MNDRLFNLINRFYRLATESEPLPKNSSDLDTILHNLTTLKTFKVRIEYAEGNLEHLSSGSSRVIYKTPDSDCVVKLAKNDKGMAQNKAEAKIKCKYVNRVDKSDPDGIWNINPLLDKITEKEFKELTDLDFKDFGEALSYGLEDVAGDSGREKPKSFDKIEKSEIYKELIKAGEKYKLLPGDLARISSWGKVDKQPILLDAGLTRKIYDEYYEGTSK